MSVTVVLGGNTDERDPTLECAIQLTKRMKTTLTGLCAMPDPANAAVYITGAETVVLGPSAIESMTVAQDELIAELKGEFDEKTQAAGSWLNETFTTERGSVATYGAAHAMLADAFIVPHGATQSNHPLNAVFEHVLMEAKLPLVLAPAKTKESDTCMIAWDGSPLSARAVRMHMPLISTYKKVVLAQNKEKTSHQWAYACKDSADRLTEILHDARLEVVHADLEGPVSKSLQEAADAHDASLIIMGAYGHARIGQMLFGGTTSKLLHSKDAPALALCH